jgi:hypothetical protein
MNQPLQGYRMNPAPDFPMNDYHIVGPPVPPMTNGHDYSDYQVPVSNYLHMNPIPSQGDFMNPVADYHMNHPFNQHQHQHQQQPNNHIWAPISSMNVVPNDGGALYYPILENSISYPNNVPPPMGYNDMGPYQSINPPFNDIGSYGFNVPPEMHKNSRFRPNHY